MMGMYAATGGSLTGLSNLRQPITNILIKPKPGEADRLDIKHLDEIQHMPANAYEF